MKIFLTPYGGTEVTVEMNLFGGFSQLILPLDIRQVESIKPLKASGEVDYRPIQFHKDIHPGGTTRPDSYSGLIVDARGIGAGPSMVPLLVDENGLV